MSSTQMHVSDKSQGFGGIISPIPDLFQVMAVKLAEARADRTFPTTTAPSTDVQATAHDYELLLQLQDARDAASNASSEPYEHRFIEVTRRIRDRDDAYNYKASRDEAVRRVESYLRSVEHEKEYYESVQSSSTSIVPPFTPVSVSSPCGRACSAVEVNEDVLSIYEQAAEQALSDLTRPLLQNMERFAQLNEEQQGLRNEQKALHHQQAAVVADQNSQLQEHREFLDRLAEHAVRQDLTCHKLEHTVQNLQIVTADSTRNVFTLQNTANATIAATTQLAQTVANLPQAIQQIVDIAVQQQAKIAIDQISNAFEVALSELEDQKLQHLHEQLGMNQTDLVYQNYVRTRAGVEDLHHRRELVAAKSKSRLGSLLISKKMRVVAKKVLKIAERA